MGNGVAKLNAFCAVPQAGDVCRRDDVVLTDDGLGHSFHYVRPYPTRLSFSPSELGQTRSDAVLTAPIKKTTFRSISGASVSANPSTVSLAEPCPTVSAASAFESSDCFASLPLQPMPSVATSRPPNPIGSGSKERGLYSGSIEEKKYEEGNPRSRRKRFSDRKSDSKPTSKIKVNSFISIFLNLISSKKNSRWKKSMTESNNGSGSFIESNADINYENATERHTTTAEEEEEEENNELLMQSPNLQWAQGKAGEDRVHLVVSEENGWVFIGIYDGFNGPDAPDYLLNNLYPAVHNQLKGLLWSDKFESWEIDENSSLFDENDETQMWKLGFNPCNSCLDEEIDPSGVRKPGKSSRNMNNVRWRCEWGRERLELDRNLKEQLNDINNNDHKGSSIYHTDVLRALSQALQKTEDAYLEIVDKLIHENAELALMGSCVLVMLMKGEDIYVMNVGDSRAVLAQEPEHNTIGGLGRKKQELERIKEESLLGLEGTKHEALVSGLPSSIPLQLTMEHSTRIKEEVKRIRKEHPGDASAVKNDRVKGYLKVTRAFGAGFLKRSKWNDAVLEMFRIDYVSTCPYITCSPSLHHHRATSRDKFLILSSDGLYEYFSNEETVFEVESFIAAFPQGDPAQHLIEEVLYRAARKFGMDVHELLEIPQGDRRRYHDDVSVIIISLEGKIWRSSM